MHFLQAINSDISVLIVCNNKTAGTIKGDIKKNSVYTRIYVLLCSPAQPSKQLTNVMKYRTTGEHHNGVTVNFLLSWEGLSYISNI